MDTIIENIEIYTQELIGKPISLPWKGYGSAIFLELGQLVPLRKGQNHNNGQACISIDWDWRLEKGTKVLFGSSNSRPEIARGLEDLKDKTIQGLELVGNVPELKVDISGGLCLRSMVAVTGDPEWSIRVSKGKHIYFRKNALRIGDGADESASQDNAYSIAKKTTKRWGTPIIEPKLGDCSKCSHLVRLDGEGCFLDYGVCTKKDGNLDGCVVNVKSGCPLFTANE